LAGAAEAKATEKRMINGVPLVGHGEVYHRDLLRRRRPFWRGEKGVSKHLGLGCFDVTVVLVLQAQGSNVRSLSPNLEGVQKQRLAIFSDTRAMRG
jgi:hypothetical protein